MTIQNQTDVYFRCEKCGSTHFYDADFKQYLARTYSSAPGGELFDARSPIRVRICSCGHLALLTSLRSLTPDDVVAVKSSFEKAQRYRQETEPEPLKASLRESYIHRAEYEALAKKFEQLRKIVAGYADERPQGATRQEAKPRFA